MLKISIVTPSFNQAVYLRATIDSVLSQGYENLEYIIIDGGSTDNSKSIISEVSKKLHYWTSKPDNGHGDALNRGFAMANGEILAWLNSDDIYTPWCFRVVSDIFEQNPDIDWIVGLSNWWDERGCSTGCRQIYKNMYDFLTGEYDWIQQESVFFRRSLYLKAGGTINQAYQLMVDGELWCRFFRYAKLHHVPVVLSGYRIHSSNRAQAYRAEVHVEMKAAIDNLRSNLSDQERLVADRLIRLKRVAKLLRSPWVPRGALDVLRRSNAKILCRASYPALEFELTQKRWIKSTKSWI